MNSLNSALASPEPLVTAEQLYRRQVEEAYRSLRQSAAFSFVGAVLTLLALHGAGDFLRGAVWFSLALAIFSYRLWSSHRFDRTHATEADLRAWERRLIVGNVLAGVQWGSLGTWLFPATDVHQQLFVVLVIVSYVCGAVIQFTALKWAHPAVAIPAAFPPIIYIFFFHSGPQWIAGTMATFFLLCIIFLGIEVHGRVKQRLQFELENRALLEKLSAYNDELGSQNQELKHRSEIVLRAEEEARRHAEVLSTHVQQTLLPVIACDAEFRILDWNQAAEELLGYAAEEVRGDNMGQLLFPVERRANIGPYVSKLFADRHPTMVEFPAIARDGQSIPVRYYLTPIYGTHGEPLRVSVIIIESYGEPSSVRYRRVPEAA
jgi:PAS domain S-box-containing protein